MEEFSMQLKHTIYLSHYYLCLLAVWTELNNWFHKVRLHMLVKVTGEINKQRRKPQQIYLIWPIFYTFPEQS